MHSDYGAFFNPRLSALVRLPRRFTARLSTGTGVFAPSPFTEETEAVGLSNSSPLRGLTAERAWSVSGDIGWSASRIELNGSLFGLLSERRFGPVRLFLNAKNLTDVRQTHYDPMVRRQRHFDGRWTVDAWALVEGRTINGGLRFSF